MNNTYKLKNGKTAKFIGYSDWDVVLLTIDEYNRIFCVVDHIIHSLTDEGEPCTPLQNDLQFTDSELSRIKQDHSSSCSF